MRHRQHGWIVALGLALGLSVGCSHRQPPVSTPPATCDARAVVIYTLDAEGRPIAGVRIMGDPAQMGPDQVERLSDGSGYSHRVACGPSDYRFERDGYVSTSQNLAGRDASGAPVAHRVHLARVVLPHPAPLRGILRVAPDGRSFVDDTGDVIPVSYHAGDMAWRYMDDPQRTRQAIEHIREAGYQIVRSWVNLHDEDAPNTFWHYLQWGPRKTPNWKQALIDYGNLLKANQLKWHMSVGGLAGYSEADKVRLYDTLIEVMRAVGPEWFVLPGEVNEARDTTDSRDPREIERLVNRIRAAFPRNLYALSAYTGTEDRRVIDEWTPEWMRFYYYHGYRHGHVWDKIRHRFSMGYEGEPVRRLGFEGESTGPGKWLSASQNQSELNDPEAMPLVLAMNVLARQIPDYISSPGIIFDEPVERMPGFRTVPALIRKLPRDVMRWPVLFHSGDTWRQYRVLVPQGDVRIDGAADGNRRAMILYGPPGSYRLPIERDFTGEMCRTTTDAVICDPITLRAGERLPVSFTVGRLLVGRVQ